MLESFVGMPGFPRCPFPGASRAYPLPVPRAGSFHDNRVSHVCPADYSEGSDMDILVKTIIDKIDLDDRLEKLEVVK